MREESLNTLRKILRDLFNARYQGGAGTVIARAQGYADGFMAAMLRARLVTQRELLMLIAEERARVAGPAMATVTVEAAA